MKSRAQLLEADGFTVMSVVGNEAAKVALKKTEGFSLFILGNGAPPIVRGEMADWLKIKHPKVPILALNPPYQQELALADYNVVGNGRTKCAISLVRERLKAKRVAPRS